MNGGMLIYPVPFNVQICHVRFRVDVGIAPYIETVRAFHSTCGSVPEGCGRLVAAPTSLLQLNLYFQMKMLKLDSGGFCGELP